MADDPKPTQPKTLAAAIAAAFAAGGLAGGSLPPIIVHGDAPKEAAGWECKPVGPALDAQLVCSFVGDRPDAGPTPVARREQCGWKPVTEGGVTVMAPDYDCSTDGGTEP